MGEKDSVPSQDIPSVLRALGTLALAAATAVAIKWYISRDKNEKAEDKELKLHGIQDPIEDGQSPMDYPKADEEILENNKKEPQVSDKQGMTDLGFNSFSHGQVKSVQDTSCPNIAYVKEDRECLTDHKRLLGDVTPVSCKLNNMASFWSTSHNSWGANISISGLPAVIVEDTTNDTQNQVFSSCFPQTFDKISHERSHDQQLNTGASSSNGECMDVINVKCLECESQPTGDDNLVPVICSKDKTVDVGLDKDLFTMDTCENNEKLNCDSEMNIANHTKPFSENKENISGSLCGMNPEGNTKEHLLVSSCAAGLPESQKNLNAFKSSYSLGHEVLKRHYNNKQQTVYATYNVQDIIQTVDLIQEAKCTTITISSEDTVLTNTPCKSYSQGENFTFKGNNHVTCTQPSGTEHKICVISEEILEEINENLKSSSDSSMPAPAHVLEDIIVKEKNRELFSSVDTLDNNHNGKQDDQIAGGSPNHMDLLCLPEACAMDEMKIKNTMYHHTNHVLQWNTRTVFNSTENIDLMYPVSFCAPENTITPLIEKYENPSKLENNVSLSTEKSMSVSNERECNNILDADSESSFEDSTFHSITAVPSTVTRNVLGDPSTLNPFDSTMVTKTETQSIVSTSDRQGNDVMYNWHKQNANSLIIDKKEFHSCAVITNEYISRYQKQVDTNNFGCISAKYTSKECFGKNQPSNISKSLSDLLQKNMEESSCRSQFCYNNNHTALYVMQDMSKTELKCPKTVQAIKQDPNLSEENMTLGRVEQTSDFDSLRYPAEKLGQSTLDHTDSSFNDVSFEQGFVTSCAPSPSHNEEEKLLESRHQERLETVESNAQTFSRERIMSTIAETPELILPEYQSVFTSEKKKPLMTKSCDNIYSGPSCQRSALKNKAQSMLCLLTELYTTKLHSAENGPLEKVARGCFIRIPKGFHNIREGVRFQLTLGNCLELLKLARKNSVPELLKEVYKLISDNYLHVLKNSAIYGQLTGLEREKILQLRMRGKLSLCVLETQSIFGLNKNISCSEDMNPEQSKLQLYSLDIESNQWKRVTNIPEEACLKGCSICSMHNYLFIAGGIQNTKNGLLCSNKLFCYNPLTDIWTQLTPMNQARSQLKLVPLDGYLYAIGGECLHTMERYDPRLNKWTFVASLPKGSFAVAHEAAACGGEIYISGGHLFYRLLKYNPVRDLWEECPFNASRGRSCDMVAVGHILYRFDMHKDSTVHIFKYNTTAKVWSEYTTTFPNSKVPFRCAVLEGTIYCLNRETTAHLSVGEEKAMFESTMFSKVPTKGIGYPCPVVLSLQGSLSQTSV